MMESTRSEVPPGSEVAVRQGAVVTLEAVSQRGKNRIREAGTDRWLVRKVDTPSCFDGEQAALVEPAGADAETKFQFARWIRLTDDANLRITAVQSVGRGLRAA